MQLRIRSQDLPLSPEARRAVERRLRLALGRHTGGIDRVQASFSRVTGPVGAGDVLCRIRARLREGDVVAAEDRAEDLPAAASGAAWRLEHRLGPVRVHRAAETAQRAVRSGR